MFKNKFLGLIGVVGRVFANNPGPKTLKMVLDTSLLNTRQYKVHIKGKVEQFWERSSALPLQLYFTYIYIYILNAELIRLK